MIVIVSPLPPPCPVAQLSDRDKKKSQLMLQLHCSISLSHLMAHCLFIHQPRGLLCTSLSRAADDGPVVDGHHQDGKRYLGYLDTTFLTAYAVAMFFSGHVGDRSNLRYFLTLGMLGMA